MGILQCDPRGFVCWMGILCSSWSAMSRGSTYRSWLAPLGLDTVKCVVEGNIMVGRWGPLVLSIPELGCLMFVRCVLLMAPVTACNGKFIVEQPRQSLLNRHPRFRWLARALHV